MAVRRAAAARSAAHKRDVGAALVMVGAWEALCVTLCDQVT